MRNRWYNSAFTCQATILVAVSAIIVPPIVTPAPKLPEVARRQIVDNTCGYYWLNGDLSTITCLEGIPCYVRTVSSPAIVYCSNALDLPVTTAFPYGYYPPGGCLMGQLCCPADFPAAGLYNYDGGKTRQVGCDSVPFTYSAFFDSASPTLQPSASISFPAFSTLPAFTSDSDNNRGSDSNPDSTTDSGRAGDGGTTTTAIVFIAVGAICALVGGLAILALIWRIWITRHRTRYGLLNAQYTPSTATKATTVSKWQLTIGILSLCVTIAGASVTAYFGSHRRT